MSHLEEHQLQGQLIAIQSAFKSQYYLVDINQKCQVVVNEFLEKINQEAKKEFTELNINSVYGQYVHSHMYVFYASSKNEEKITICLSLYDFEPGTAHGFIDCIFDGHSPLEQCQKKLKQGEKWPDSESYHLSDENDIIEVSGIISNRIQIINQKIEPAQEEYKVIRCWTETIQGINYFVHAESTNGAKITILIVITEGQELGGEEESQISLKCCKGFQAMQEFQEIVNKQNKKE